MLRTPAPSICRTRSAGAKADGIHGRRRLEDSDGDKMAAIVAAHRGTGIRRIARDLGVGVGTVLRVTGEVAQVRTVTDRSSSLQCCEWRAFNLLGGRKGQFGLMVTAKGSCSFVFQYRNAKAVWRLLRAELHLEQSWRCSANLLRLWSEE